jgi:HSP20 family molecular chaperone IbpA
MRPSASKWNARRPMMKFPASQLSFRQEKQPLVDIFEEEDWIMILAELPGMEEKDVHIEAAENAVTITAENTIKKYSETIRLPTAVAEGSVKFIYRNNILQARLRKIQKDLAQNCFEASSGSLR